MRAEYFAFLTSGDILEDIPRDILEPKMFFTANSKSDVLFDHDQFFGALTKALRTMTHDSLLRSQTDLIQVVNYLLDMLSGSGDPVPVGNRQTNREATREVVGTVIVHRASVSCSNGICACRKTYRR